MQADFLHFATPVTLSLSQELPESSQVVHVAPNAALWYRARNFLEEAQYESLRLMTTLGIPPELSVSIPVVHIAPTVGLEYKTANFLDEALVDFLCMVTPTCLSSNKQEFHATRVAGCKRKAQSALESRAKHVCIV